VKPPKGSSYDGPRHGLGDDDWVSVTYWGGIVVGSQRTVEEPVPTRESRAIARRICRRVYVPPARPVLVIMQDRDANWGHRKVS
jgi:hypothetical protein